jgi:sulfhydrogenase subunit delta
MRRARLDMALVEGAVLSQHDEDRLKAIRARSDRPGCPGHLRGARRRAHHGPGPRPGRPAPPGLRGHGLGYDTQSARPLHEVVRVDLAITGCPIEKDEFLRAIGNLLNGDPPLAVGYPVCTECKMRESKCLLARPGRILHRPGDGGGLRCPLPGAGHRLCRLPGAGRGRELRVDPLRCTRSVGVEREHAVRRMRTFAATPVGA